MIDTDTPHGLAVDLRHEAPDAYRALAALTRASTLDHGLAELMKVRASQLNGCAYCVDLHVRLALKAGEHQRRLHALAVWRESPFFSDRERAALGADRGPHADGGRAAARERRRRRSTSTSIRPSAASWSW